MFVYIIQTESLMMYSSIILFSLHILCIKVKTGFDTILCHLQEVLDVVYHLHLLTNLIPVETLH
jgi:hypothetical protein